MKELIARLKDIAALSEELLQQLYSIVSDKPYKNDDYFLKAGEVDRHIWFIEKGLVVIYRDSKAGRKVTHILGAGDFVIATDSFSSGCPTKDNILVLEDTVTWRTTRADLMGTCKMHPEFFIHYTTIEGIYRKLESKFNSQSPKERFDELWDTRRDLFNRVKKELLASYLGMSVKTFDSLRRDKLR